jgi:hypothetical protein
VSVCVAGGVGVLRLAVAAFTLSWTHSVQKTRWEEDWVARDGLLEVVEARIESMGAGMETPPDAVRDGRFWKWRPKVPPLKEVLLRRSDAVPEGWTLCAAGQCRRIGAADETADIVRLTFCD